MVLSKEVMTQMVGTGVARLEGVFDCIPKYRYIWFPEPEGRVWKACPFNGTYYTSITLKGLG